jgi:hypothetical protein
LKLKIGDYSLKFEEVAEKAKRYGEALTAARNGGDHMIHILNMYILFINKTK